MQISNRLQMVASMVTAGNTVADIGTDHAYIPIELVKSGKIPSAIAMDINRGPLQKAKENLIQYGLEDRIDTRLSDGLDALKKGEVQTIVIAGMGGPLMVRILKNGWDRLCESNELILQPQSDIQQVRSFVQENGWTICQEEMILEDGKYYPMMKVLLDQKYFVDKKYANMSLIELKYGPLLLSRKHPVLKGFLLHEKRVNEKILSSLEGQASMTASARRETVQEELQVVLLALTKYIQEG